MDNYLHLWYPNVSPMSVHAHAPQWQRQIMHVSTLLAVSPDHRMPPAQHRLSALSASGSHVAEYQAAEWLRSRPPASAEWLRSRPPASRGWPGCSAGGRRAQMGRAARWPCGQGRRWGGVARDRGCCVASPCITSYQLHWHVGFAAHQTKPRDGRLASLQASQDIALPGKASLVLGWSGQTMAGH